MAIKLTHSSLLVLTLLLTMTFRIDGRLVAAEDSSKQAEFFEKKVRPLLAKRCYECHDEVTGHDNGGLVLETIEGIVTGGSRGPVIDSSDPESSLLLQAVTFDEDDLQMPPSGKMPAAEIEIITKWLKDGAILPKYRPQKPAPDARGNVRNVDRRADDFWSFRTLQDVPVPQFE
ncbi:MAG: hypothetical protein KDA91_18040, partial [Planctomycetaceae bacterium]|nr:hypothetical protein [Planctomycetaceae bacterium]